MYKRQIYARYQESIRGADVFLIQSVCASETFDVNDALMELLIMADAAKRASARSISAVIAHYGYARQDRKAAPREPITAKLVADPVSYTHLCEVDFGEPEGLVTVGDLVAYIDSL